MHRHPHPPPPRPGLAHAATAAPSPWRMPTMAKALFGHVGVGPDVRVLAEMRRLSDRVRELEHEVARLEAANAALRHGLHVDDDMLSLSVPDSIQGRDPASSCPAARSEGRRPGAPFSCPAPDRRVTPARR